jgi:hypothetical protein
MASKQRADKQKEKEKKEKIILLALVALLVIVGAFELPKMLKKSPSSSASSVALTTSSSSATSSSGTPTSTSTNIGSLPNSNTYMAGQGKLSGFSLFNIKDPFGSVTTSSSTNSTSTSPTTSSGKTNSTTTTPQGDYVAARISVNGASEDVALNATFPSASPVFVLNSVSAKKIKISVAGGSFSSGQSKVAINKGKSVALVNTVDSTKYVIKFVTALTASQASSTTGGTTTGGTTAGGTTAAGTTAGGTTAAGTTTSATTSSTTT